MASLETERAKALALAQAQALASQQQPSVTEDVAKSGASGLARGAADLVGLPGTIGDALRGGMQWGLGKGYELVTGEKPGPDSFFGSNPEMEAKMIGGGSNPLGGENLRAGLSTLTGGATDYQPQTTAGEYARTVGEFAPAALTGPGGVIRKAAMATVPAVASETAGQLTEGTAAEPWARFGGALAGGLATAGRVNPTKVVAKGAPTREGLRQSVDDAYTNLRNQGIKYDSNTWNQIVGNLHKGLHKEGFRPSTDKEAIAFADELLNDTMKAGGGKGISLDFDDIDKLRKRANDMVRSVYSNPQTKHQGPAWEFIRDSLENFQTKAPMITQTGLPQSEINRLTKEARRLALRKIKDDALEEIGLDAKTYISGVDSGIRNKIGSLLRSKRGRQLFSDAEKTELLRVQQGRQVTRTLSSFGFSLGAGQGNNNLGGILTTLSSPSTAMMAANPLAAIPGLALVGAGTAAKAALPKMAEKSLDKAAAAIRSGKLTGRAGEDVTRLLKEQQLRRLLSAQMGLTGAQSQ